MNTPDLQYLLYHMKDQLQPHRRLGLPANIDSDIWSYYKLFKIQAFILIDTLFVILTLPWVDESLTFLLHRIHSCYILF